MISALDDAVGVIAGAVESENLSSNTLIVFSSDNGGPNPGKLSDNGVLRAGKGSVYEGGVRVAAFANWPGKIKAGSTIQAPVHIADWYPTLLKLSGSVPEQKLPIDGRDISGVLTGGEAPADREILINTTPRNGAIRVGDWKLVINGGRVENEDAAPAPSGTDSDSDGAGETKKEAKSRQDRIELFNLAEDISEKHDLSAANPDKVKQLLARYQTLAAQAVPPKAQSKPDGYKSPAVWGQAPVK
jgi:arylsulfatase A-like enzyme